MLTQNRNIDSELSSLVIFETRFSQNITLVDTSPQTRCKQPSHVIGGGMECTMTPSNSFQDVLNVLSSLVEVGNTDHLSIPFPGVARFRSLELMLWGNRYVLVFQDFLTKWPMLLVKIPPLRPRNTNATGWWNTLIEL